MQCEVHRTKAKKCVSGQVGNELEHSVALQYGVPKVVVAGTPYSVLLTM